MAAYRGNESLHAGSIWPIGTSAHQINSSDPSESHGNLRLLTITAGAKIFRSALCVAPIRRRWELLAAGAQDDRALATPSTISVRLSP